jgi:tight adherence protein C
MTMILLLVVTFAALITISAYSLLQISRHTAAVQARVQMVRGHAVGKSVRHQRMAPSAAARAEAMRVPLKMVSAIGASILRTGIMSSNTLAALEQTLSVSGIRSANALPLFIGCKILLLGIAPAITWLAVSQYMPGSAFVQLAPGIAAIGGLLLPDMVIRKIRNGYVQRVEQGIPDALDMMVICARAGLSLEPAITRVADEIRHARPEVARELQQTASELMVASESKIALNNLGIRTGLDSLKRLASTLVQTMEYGTPLVDALRSLSAEMRTEVLTRAEERAARLPVLLTVPMIVFILPCQFIVAAGPAVLQFAKAFPS